MGDRLNEQQKAEAEEENQRRFMSWAKEMGVEAPNISPASFAGGLRGMRADKAIGAGEDLVTLPRTSALQVADREPCPFPGELSPLFWSEASLSVKLGVVLLREELLGAASSSAAYLAILPRAFDGSPCWWDPAELPQLQDPVLEEEVRETNRKLAAIHMELLAAARGKSVLRNATLDEFRWAMACVMSRSFAGELPAAPPSSALDLTARLLVFRVASLLSEAVGGMFGSLFASQPALSAAKMRARGVLRSLPPAWIRTLDGSAGSQELLLLEPLVDFLNHQTTGASETTYDAGSDRVRVRTCAEWREGEQVYICYGAKANRALLLSYGFVENGNPMDFSLVAGLLDAAEAGLAAAGEGKAEGAEWQARTTLLLQEDLIAPLLKAKVTAAGIHGSGAAGLRLLLCSDAEFLAARQLPRGRRAGAAVGLEGERRALCVVVALVEGIVAEAPTSLEQDEAVLAALDVTGGFGGGERENALRYRSGRKALLKSAAKAMRERERLSADVGAVVQAQDGWLEAQEHEQLRHLNNLGF